MTIAVTKIKLHIVSRRSFSDAFYADFDVLMKNRVNPDDIWHKGLHNRPTWVRVLQFAVGKVLRPLTKKF